MKLWPWSLRWQMAAATALATAAATLLVVAGLGLYYKLSEQTLLARVSPETRQVLENLDLGMQLTAGRAEEINQLVAGATIFQLEPFVFLGLAVTGILVGAFTGSWAGRRIAEPLENVARAVAAVASGEQHVRAVVTRRVSGEPAALIDNFNRMAEGLDRVERELVESASATAHELRTPVTVLRARLQAMLDGVFQPSERELAGLIAQTDMLSAIIDNLRVLSLAGANRLQLNCRLFDLAEEVTTVLSALGRDLEVAGISVETRFEPAPVRADASRIRQIVTAFIDNVCRYAASGGVVRVETYQVAQKSGLRVLDRGPGLPVGTHEVAFDRFWRAEPSRARHTGGTGLGLAVVRAIAEEHGGRAYAQPRADGGTEFGIELPIAWIQLAE